MSVDSGLSKSVWSDADFELMGWHDATLHGMYLEQAEEGPSRLLLDIDYIVQWVHPVARAKYFRFWVAPATLVFTDVWSLEFDGSGIGLEIDTLHRPTPDGTWRLEGHNFEMRFSASGYRQYFRQPPRLTDRQVLSPQDRGGCSFAEVAFN